MRNSHYAHTLPGCSESDWHLLDTHLQATSETAAAFASHFEADRWGALAGLWHDLGKYSDAFQSYLRGAGATDTDHHVVECRGSVDHSTAGAQHAVRYQGTSRPPGRILAYCIAGHHAGLLNRRKKERGLLTKLPYTIKLEANHQLMSRGNVQGIRSKAGFQ